MENEPKVLDYIIVGLGIAGIQVSFELLKRGKLVHHFHYSLPGESTRVAAGLINQITGRRFVKSWMIEEVMPFAEQRYLELEGVLGGSYLNRLHIARGMKTASEENTWLSKSSDPYLSQFYDSEKDDVQKSLLKNRGAFAQKLVLPELMGELSQCFRISLIELQQDYIKHLEQKELITKSEFDYSALELKENQVNYKGIQAKNIIFVEGWKVLQNPFFQIPAFSPAKGELFIIRAPKLKLEAAYKKEMFITPLGNDLYWCGATYEWNNLEAATSQKMTDRLQEFLDSTLKVDYEIIHHHFGLRPSSKDRRPILGTHPEFSQISIFNGMGTKGSSLSPFYSQVLVDHLELKKDIPPEVNVNRYF